jgi:hypothetical protein
MNMKMWMDGRQEDILRSLTGEDGGRPFAPTAFSVSIFFWSACEKLCRCGDAGSYNPRTDSCDLVHEFYAVVRFFVFLTGCLFEASRPFACFRSGVALVFFFFE